MAYRLPINAAACLTAAICCAALLAFALSFEGLVRHFVDADKLLAADLVQRVFVLGRPWSDFQLPRTPSLFPDLLVFSPLHLASSWQLATLAFAWLMLMLLVLVGALMAHRATRAPFWLCVVSMLMIVVPLCLAEQWLSGRGEGRHYFALSMVSHGGAFVMSLLAIACCEVAEDLPRARRRLAYAAIALVAAAIVLSDKLAVLELSVPAAMAGFVCAKSRSHALWLAVALGIGTASALVGDRFLVRQPDWPLAFHEVPARIVASFTMTPFSIVIGTWLPAAAFVLLPPVLFLRSKRSMRRAKFYWLAGASSVVLTAALTYAFLFEDGSHIRYVHTLLWWPVVALAGALATAIDRMPIKRVAAVALMAMCVASAGVLVHWQAGALMQWQYPLATCLAQAHQRLNLNQGLASYDFARPLTVASGWRMQVDPIEPRGELSFWGSDLRSSSYRLRDPSVAPLYDFILLDKLDPGALAQRFGSPDEEFACGDARFWVFRRGLSPLPPG